MSLQAAAGCFLPYIIKAITDAQFRTVGGRFWYRVLSHICYRFFPMSCYSMFYIPPCILSFASILYYATKASKGNVAISEFRFGMVLVGWLTKYVLMAFYSFL